METIRNAATAAASLVGLGGTEENRENETSTGHIAGGQAPQYSATGTSQSGVEPVSGKLGRGEAGEPYDAGNVDRTSALGGSSTHGTSSDYTSSRNTGTGLGSGLTGGSVNSGPTGSGIGSSTNTSGPTGSGIGSNTTTSNTSSSEPLSEKVRETLGVGSGNKQSTGLGGRNDGPGYGTASNRDRDSTLGSAIGHGSNPDKHAYDSNTAPGIGGQRIGDDFSSSNTRSEGRASLPTGLGSDTGAGRSAGGLTGRSGNESYSSGTGQSLTEKAKEYLPGTNNQSSSGGFASRSDNNSYSSSGNLTGRSDNNNYTSGTGKSLTEKAKEYLPGTGSQTSSGGVTGRSDNDQYSSRTGGESLTQKAQDYLPGTGSTSNRQNDSALAGAREVISGSGRDGSGYNSSSTYGSSNTSSLPVRSHDSSLTGDRGLTGSSTGSGLTGTGSSGLTSGLTGSSTTGSHSHSHGISGAPFDQEREGYVPHGGHPIGEAAHNTEEGKQTWLDYRNDPTLPVARANPADQ